MTIDVWTAYLVVAGVVLSVQLSAFVLMLGTKKIVVDLGPLSPMDLAMFAAETFLAALKTAATWPIALPVGVISWWCKWKDGHFDRQVERVVSGEPITITSLFKSDTETVEQLARVHEAVRDLVQQMGMRSEVKVLPLMLHAFAHLKNHVGELDEQAGTPDSPEETQEVFVKLAHAVATHHDVLSRELEQFR